MREGRSNRKPSIVRRLLRFVFVTLPAVLIVLTFLVSAIAWPLSYHLTANWYRVQPDGTLVSLALVADRSKLHSPTMKWPPPMYFHLEARNGTAAVYYYDERYVGAQVQVQGFEAVPQRPSNHWFRRFNLGSVLVEFGGSTWIGSVITEVRLWFSTTVLGGLAAMILLLRYRSRRRFRRRTGLCMACGYDLTGNASGACPECGRAMA